MKFVEERLRKQANELAREELRKEMEFIGRSNYLSHLNEDRGQIMYWEDDKRYSLGCRIYCTGETEAVKEKIKELIDKRTEEIYEKLADELLTKISSLEFLFKGE